MDPRQKRERASDDPRYSRQILFTPIGAEGQDKLSEARVAIIGMGALGTVLANHMVRGGVGLVRLIDRDFVEISNLQRQMLFEQEDAELSIPKAVAAANRLRRFNDRVRIEPHVADFNPANAEALLADLDLVLDGTDNFAARYLINDACIQLGVPWIHGAAVGARGVYMNIVPGKTPCFRCVYPVEPKQGTVETCDTAGVISPVTDIVASLQAAEAIKMLVGDDASLQPGMVHFDLWRNSGQTLDLSRARRPDCPACALGKLEYLRRADESEIFQTLCGRDSVQITPAGPSPLDLKQWAKRLEILGKTEINAFLLKFHVSREERIVLFPDGRMIVQGTGDPVRAKSLISRYIGR